MLHDSGYVKYGQGKEESYKTWLPVKGKSMVKRIKGLHLPTRKKEYRLTYKNGVEEIILSKNTLMGRICKEDLLKIEQQIYGIRYDSTRKPSFYIVVKEKWLDVTNHIKKEYEYLCNDENK